MPAVKTHLLASVATLAGLAGLGDRPAQAANYGSLPQLLPEQITQDTCYMEDANGVILDLSWICDGGQGNVLPTIAVKNVSKPKAPKVIKKVIKPGLTVNIIKRPVVAAPDCQTNPEFSSCKPPVIEITGGSSLEAIQELNAAPLSPYDHLGF